MARSLLEDAFAHHDWATVRLIDTCAALTPEQLATVVPSTYGSILDTLRHLVSSDAFYTRVTGGELSPVVDLNDATLSELRDAMQVNAAGWLRVLAANPDADTVLTEVDPDDGYQRDAPMGMRLVDALYHGEEHRSQVCAALSTLGVEPPGISVVDFGVEKGVVTEVYPGELPATVAPEVTHPAGHASS
jgi:uncharacterized damage-inducible protein DinB